MNAAWQSASVGGSPAARNTPLDSYPLNVNDKSASERIAEEDQRVAGQPRPQFAPVLHPTLETGMEAMATAAMAWNRA
jgi:hippurate hydrolase